VFYVLNGRKLKRYLLAIVGLLLAVGVIMSEKDHITVFAPQMPAAVYSVPTDEKIVALTFDISWGDKRAEPIIEILKEKGVKEATFFLSSPWVQSHPDIVKKIMDAGFEIGSHGHKHDFYTKLSDDEIRSQIRTAESIIASVTGKRPRLIRMPNGDFDKRVLRIVNELGYTVIQWDTDSLDWMNIGTDKIIRRVVSRAHPGDIILMHASDSSKQTHEALPVIIDQLRDKGYSFVSVSRLLSRTEVQGRSVQDRPGSTPAEPAVPTEM